MPTMIVVHDIAGGQEAFEIPVENELDCETPPYFEVNG